MFPITKDLTRCVVYKRKKSTCSISPLLSSRKKYQSSVPVNLQDEDEDEALNYFLGRTNEFPHMKKLSTSKSSPTILISTPADGEEFPPQFTGFPLPEEVSSDDPVFSVVAVEVHDPPSPHGEDICELENNFQNWGKSAQNEGEIMGEMHDEIGENRHQQGVISTANCPRYCQDGLSNGHCSLDEAKDTERELNNLFAGAKISNKKKIDLNRNNGVTGGKGKVVSPLSNSFCNGATSSDLEGSIQSKSSKGGKIGYFEDSEFASMKHTMSGKVWLWTRSEDILVIEDDGRIIDPTWKKKSRCPKSYQNQIKSSIGKLYDLFFSRKEKEPSRLAEKWATSSLDRHLGKISSCKQNMQASVSLAEMTHCRQDNSQ